jgi:hypothetical protein
MTDRKKPGMAFWANVAVVAVLVGYPLSFGPVCWGWSRFPDWRIWEVAWSFYHPMLWMWWSEHDGLGFRVIDWYVNLGAAFRVEVAYSPTDGSFHAMRFPIP